MSNLIMTQEPPAVETAALAINARTLANLSNPSSHRDQAEYTPLTCAHGCDTCKNCHCD